MSTQPTPQPRFGRIISIDERDKNYPMRLMLDPVREQFFPRGIPEGTRHYFAGPMLNQGNTGTCVAFSLTSKINAAPIMQRLPMSEFDLYRRIVPKDEWPDNDHEATAPDNMLQSGTSVRAGTQALQDMGLIQNYLWAESVEDVRAFILAGLGGVVLGTWWKSGMMKPDADGFINYTGGNEGGHAYYVNGWNDRVKVRSSTLRTRRAGRIKQSWGDDWGDGGYCWFAEDGMDAAIKDQGEAVALIEIKVMPRRGDITI